MQENNLLDEDSIDSKSSLSNQHFKLMALGSLIFITGIYLKYMFQNAIIYFGFKFGFGDYTMFWTNKILSILFVALILSFIVRNRWNSLLKKMDNISRFIRIHFILLTFVLISHQVLAKIINHLYNQMSFRANGFIYNSEYMSFEQIADPLMEAISILLLTLVMTRNLLAKNG